MSPQDDRINVDIVIAHWKEASEGDYQTMLTLHNAKSYHWALFVGHITIEKLLKASFVKVNKKHAPPIHNLYRLAELCRLDLSNEYADWLDIITSFNINARYDDFKKEFYNQCTSAYTKLWISRINELRKWIIQKL